MTTTGASSESSIIKDLVTNLSSKDEKEKNKGWNDVLSFAKKLAPALIAFI